MHAPEESIEKYLGRYQGGWEALRAERYARMLEMGIIDRERWPLPEPERRVQDWEAIDHKEWRIRNQAIYAAMVDHMDQAVGAIVAELKAGGFFEDTLIIYCHDNGACPEHLKGNGWNTANNVLAKAEEEGKSVAMGDVYDVPMGGPLTYGSVGHNWASAQNTPMRRFKSNVHNGGACTPAIMHWPNGMRTEPGSITQERGHVVDLMATCLELAAAGYPAGSDGHPVLPHESRSLVPVLRGESLDRHHAYLFNHSGTHAVVRGDFKAVREGKGPWVLYNIARERTEITNVATEYPEIVEDLANIWEGRWGDR